jgi:hypothetical protein
MCFIVSHLEYVNVMAEKTISTYFCKAFDIISKFEMTRNCKGKGKTVPLQARSDPEVSRKLRFPDYMTTAQDGGKVVSLTHRPPLPPGNAPGTHLC